MFDNDMVADAHINLDLLLVFVSRVPYATHNVLRISGLSAILITGTFVTQTSQALSNNFTAVSTALLLEMVTP